MTLPRDPVTIENTLYEVFAKLGGIEHAAAVVDRAIDTLRAWSIPERRERLTIEDAIKLDLEYAARGGEGFPLYETYGLILSAERDVRFREASEMGRLAVSYVREHGEAGSALVALSLPGATRADDERALRELEEGHSASTAAIAALRAKLRKPALEPPP